VQEREKLSALYVERARAALKALLPVAEQARVALAIETRSHYEQVPNRRNAAAAGRIPRQPLDRRVA